MRIEEMVSKYIKNVERVLKEINITKKNMNVDRVKVLEIIEITRNYLNDAKYYEKNKKMKVGLASISYCEGLLDSLRFLGVAEFSW